MKKVALSLMALAVVAAGAFADAPKWDPKVTTELKGDASVTFGYDLDQGVYAFANSTSVDLVVDLISSGDRSTTSDKDVWGEIKVITDGDPVRLAGKDHTLSGYAVKVDFAKIHFGKDAYLSVTSYGTTLEYATKADTAFLASKFDNTKRYSAGAAKLLAGLSAVGPATAGGVEVGYALPKIVSVTVDAGSVKKWEEATVNLGTKDANVNKVAYKGEVAVTALSDLGIDLTAGYSSSTVKETASAMGGKASYTFKIDGDKLFVKAGAGYTIFDPATKAAKAYNLMHAGVLLGLGSKGDAFDNYGLKTGDAYPGVSVGYYASTAEVVNKTGDKKADTGINVGLNSGSLLGDLSVVAAYDILTKAKDAETALTVGAGYKVVLGDITIAPKGAFTTQGLKGAYKDVKGKATDSASFVQTTTEITGVIPFVTFSVNTATNDLSNGKIWTDPDTKKTVADKTGKLEFVTKIAF